MCKIDDRILDFALIDRRFFYKISVRFDQKMISFHVKTLSECKVRMCFVFNLLFGMDLTRLKGGIKTTYQSISAADFDGGLEALRQQLEQSLEFGVERVEAFSVYFVGAGILAGRPKITPRR